MAKKKVPSIVKEVKQFKPQEVDYRYQRAISFSQFSMFEACPHKWTLQYRDGHYRSESSIHMTFGTAMHAVMQEYLTVFYNESKTSADQLDLETMFEQQLRETYRSEYEKNAKQHF